MVSSILDGPRQRPANGAAPTSLAILLHGVGSDGNDLMGLVPHWANFLPGTEFVSPHAPYPYDMAAQGRQWFALQDFSPEAMFNGVSETTPILQEFIYGELERTGVPSDRLVLVGFSQGTMMSLHVGFCSEPPIAGVLGYSGRMILDQTGQLGVKYKPPAMLIHGDGDDLVPVDSMLEAVQQLSSHGARAQWHICQGLGHSIDQQGLGIGGRFLRDCLTGMA
jgi:phospholipase/carboxylesterase